MADIVEPSCADLESALGMVEEDEDRPRPEAVSLALSTFVMPCARQILLRQRTAPGQGGEDRFAYKRKVVYDLSGP
jgi:hypothetical protein